MLYFSSMLILCMLFSGMLTLSSLILTSILLSTRMCSDRCVFMNRRIAFPVCVKDFADLPWKRCSRCSHRRLLVISGLPYWFCSLSHFIQGLI